LENKIPGSRSWMKNLTLILAMIPVTALISITVYLFIKSLPAITGEGLKELFSAEFSGIYSGNQGLYGLLPALWGTVLVIIIAMVTGTVVSISMAIVSNDLSSGFLGTVIRWIIGVLSGIPPIVFAVMGTLFFSLFIVPKFLGLDLPPENRPVLGLPSDASCTLLGGLLLALLIVPFMTPLIDDALQSVPRLLREASFSLGVNRWYTLTRVTIPFAMPGITRAVTLGTLIAMGDAIIVTYTIGLEAQQLPSPLCDVLERIAPLTSVAAGLAGGGFSRAEGGPLVQKSVAAFIGLLLLVVAFAILSLAAYLQNRFRKKLYQ
jgi:phosphate transport system permease protein